MKKILVFLTLLFLSNFIYSQESPETIIEKFFETYEINTDKAIDDIYATNPWISNKKDQTYEMKRTIQGYSEVLGEYHGFELLTKQKSTERFILYAYMMRFDRQPMKVTFEFYKPDGEWMLYSLNFEADIDEDVEIKADFYLQYPHNKD